MTFDEKMTAIANEVRTLSGATDALNLDEIASHTKDANNEVVVQGSLIRQIQNALEGKGSVGGTTPANPVLEPLFVTENGTYTPAEGVDGFTPVIVDVGETIPEGYIKPSGKKTISQNGTDIDVAEFAKVDVSVPVPDGYIKPSGTKSITANGTHDAREYDSVTVNVPIPNGYIKPSGKKTISENGENINVLEYATVDVNVPIPSGYIKPSGTLEITENGSYDITQLERVEVNVESGGDIDGLIDGTIKEITSNVIHPLEGALEHCSGLETANFPSAVEVSYSMFRSCTSLKNVSFPKAEAIYSDAFYDCSSLEVVNFPSVTTIDSYAFEQCVNLSKVDLGQAQSIHGAAFYDCSNLTVLILRGENVCILGSGLQGTSLRSRGYVYVLKKLVDTYKKTTNWAAIADRFLAIEDYPEICGG